MTRLKLPGAMLAAAALAASDDGQRLLRVDHYVRVKSIAPSMNGQIAQVYVREVVRAGTALRGGAPLVLFIHGAGTPAEVAFDVPYADYSWMAFLARAGYDVFAMDMTGYGRSTRPGPMNDPCNLSKEQRLEAGARDCAEAAPAGESSRATTIESDWHDIGAVVEYVRGLRGARKLNLVGWSLGGPRAGGYTAKHPEHVERLVLLSPAYSGTNQPPTGAAGANRAVMAAVTFNAQTRADFDANWDRQIGCPDQFEMAAREPVWTEMLASDPVGATWGPGVRRAPNVGGAVWQGWSRDVVAGIRVPALFVAAAQDKQVLPDRVRALHEHYGASDKVLVDLACASHNALWEKNHRLLFQASLEWFSQGTVSGNRNGVVKLGY